MGFPGGSDGEESACNAGDLGLIPGSGRSPGAGNGNLFQYACLENPGTGEPGGLQSMGSQRVMTEGLSHFPTFHRLDTLQFIYPLKDIFVASRFWQLRIK